MAPPPSPPPPKRTQIPGIHQVEVEPKDPGPGAVPTAEEGRDELDFILTEKLQKETVGVKAAQLDCGNCGNRYQAQQFVAPKCTVCFNPVDQKTCMIALGYKNLAKAVHNNAKENPVELCLTAFIKKCRFWN